ncbi:MAG: bifunctional hydroxymethylpyrimidine kinase/phosphomethylpyrimidine kinase [Candidatus Aegiribacteria sp.]|nr:bifunctional hydroxymethylpyrimidine kinase/phosphomethylpyrimidine kinase [Candidatus Aegiribacteria sp.]
MKSEDIRPVLLLAGGTDPSGGAGLAADLKTAAAMGIHGCPVVTALTVQNSGNVLSWEAIPAEKVAAQIRTICTDGPVSAVKSGMLGTAENAIILSETLNGNLLNIPYVLDPVLAAGSGYSLADSKLLEVLKRRLLPLSTLCTPNLDEAEILTGISIRSKQDMENAGEALLRMGAEAVLVKGGHLKGDPEDVLITSLKKTWFGGSRITAENVHGTGCTLATSCAALLALGFPVEEALHEARLFVRRVISRSFRRIHGNIPGHFPEAGPLPSKPDVNSFYLPPGFCGTCGYPLQQLPGGEGHLHCGFCGNIHYRNPLPAVALIVHDFDRILLVKRAVPPKKDLLSLPGGFLETGETPLECGSRELKEETNLELTDSRLFGLETDITAYGGILLVAFEVTGWKGTAKPGDDASAIMWVPIKEVPHLAFEAHNRLIKELQNTI